MFNNGNGLNCNSPRGRGGSTKRSVLCELGQSAESSSPEEEPLEELRRGGAEGARLWRCPAAQEGLRSSSSPSAAASLSEGEPAPRAHRLA